MFIDNRDGSRPFAEIAPLDAIAVLVRLEDLGFTSGDVYFSGNGAAGPINIGIEIKSVQDLVSSIETGRLTGIGGGIKADGGVEGGQLRRMLKEYDISYLLYYGSYRAGAENQLQIRYGSSWKSHKLGGRPVPYSWLEGFLLDVRDLGVGLKHAYDEVEAARWINVCHRHWDKKPSERYKAFRKFNEANSLGIIEDLDSGTVRRMEVARKLLPKGIGWEKALAAANYFPSVRSMVNADVKDWAQVAGIGLVLAKAIVANVK